MNKNKLVGMMLVGIAAAVVAGAVYELRKRKSYQRLVDVANEGYETAFDIIHPRNSRLRRPRKLKYGPTFPEL